LSHLQNKYLIRHLEELGLWGDEVVEHLINENGSIKNLKIVPEEVRDIYPTVWELSLKVQIDMAADRGAYICQSQSFNVHMDSPSMERMKDVYMYSWKKKLKTQSYYFRTNAATTNQKVTVKRQGSQAIEEDDDCEVCGS
jgi:ribonucleoside-diphosphate reductase alpha chain